MSVLGTIFRTTPGATFRPWRISAAACMSSKRPLVHDPMKAEPILVPARLAASTTSSGWPGRDICGVSPSMSISTVEW